ncbi:MAG TPA: thioredoxin family protein [Haliangiales bacterium]|nr:thioredoxin family protein [Haliangiales bacterium]
MRWKVCVFAMLAATSAAAGEGRLPWLEDSYAVATSLARAKKVPVVVDLWAPWCHSCLSMQSFVFTDPSLRPLADRFVWAAVDTEKSSNAPVLAKLPIDAWPTFYVLDPETGSVVARHIGTMSVAELGGFLEDGERMVSASHAPDRKPGDAVGLLAAGDAAVVAGRDADAARLYGEALAKAPAGWPRRGSALVSRIRALQRLSDWSACADQAMAEMGNTGDGPPAADFAAYSLDCAEQLKDDPRAARLRAAAVARLEALAADPRAQLSADDRGDMWRTIWGLREKAGDKAGARAAAEKRRDVLEAAAAKAPDAWAASTYDWARAETFVYLGQPEEAVKLLEKSEVGLPADYNPPARLARVYYDRGRYGEALAAVDRALAKAYGPRKAGVLRLKTDILDKQGRAGDAAKVLAEEIALWESLPAEQRRPAALEAAKKRLDAVRATASKP